MAWRERSDMDADTLRLLLADAERDIAEKSRAIRAEQEVSKELRAALWRAYQRIGELAGQDEVARARAHEASMLRAADQRIRDMNGDR